jgi:hypothetical protein
VNELAAVASFGVRGVEVITNEALYRNEELGSFGNIRRLCDAVGIVESCTLL